MTVHLFGIRHHGPGSARSLACALEDLRPDAVLVEGPPDAHEMLPLLAHEEMKPPVALLVYVPDEPRRAVYYPLAVFSLARVYVKQGKTAEARRVMQSASRAYTLAGWLPPGPKALLAQLGVR